jgi:phospholipid N-methyltransferase
MADKLQLLVEANERGLLKGNHKAMYDEAVSRGLIKPSQPEAEGGLSAAFGAGVDKVQELGYRAVKGFTDVGVPEEEQTDAIGKAIGQGGSLSQWAQKGIDRNVEEQKAYKPTVGSYKDISGLSDLGSYTGELVAGSLPYMAGAATGVGAFGMAGGLSNEAYEKQPEGEKDEVKAVASGAGQMLLERLGIKVSMGQLGKDILKDGVVETAKRMGRGELVEAVRDPSFAKRILKGAGMEGLTETGQEALAQWGAGKSIDEFEGLDEAFVGGVLVGGVMRTGSETAQKAMGYQQKSAEAVKNGADQLVEAGATPEEAIETVKKQQYESAIKQGFTEAEAAAIVARTMKEKFGIDDPVFAAAAEPVTAPEAEQAQTIPEDTETPVFKNDDVNYDAPTAARQAGFDQTAKAAGQYGDMLTSPAQQSLKDLDAGNNAPTVDERVKAAAFNKSPTPDDRFSPMKYQHEGELLGPDTQNAQGIDNAPIEGQAVPAQGKLPTTEQTQNREMRERAQADLEAQPQGIEQKDIIFGEDGRPQQRAAEQIKQAGKDAQNLLPQKDIVFAGNESGVNVAKNGEAFKTKRDALLSKEARAARRAGHKTKAVSFDNGFGWTIKGDDGTKQDSEQAAAEQSPKSDTVAQNEQGDQAQPAKQEGEALSLNVDAAPSKDEEDDKNIAVNDKVNGVEVIDTPVSELSLSKDIPQFKSGSNVDGVVEPLTGKFDPIGMSPVQVWVRNGGNKEIITGRHRFDLAKRDGIENIPAQYHYESDGFTADDGKRLDAILNIREDKGQVEDYVELFKQDGITESEAKQYGLLDRATGRTAFKIANSATNETIEAQRTGRISAQAAEAIADAAPGNERLQILGIKSIADDQRSITFAKNLIHAVSALNTNQDQGGESGDLFGFDDSAMQEAEQMAKVAAANQRDIRNRLSAIRGAANKPEIAKAEGINVKNPKALKKRTDELANEVKAWDSWHTNPEMVQQIRDSISAPNTETSAPNTAPITETAAEPEAAEQDITPALFGDSEANSITELPSNKQVTSYRALNGKELEAQAYGYNGRTTVINSDGSLVPDFSERLGDYFYGYLASDKVIDQTTLSEDIFLAEQTVLLLNDADRKKVIEAFNKKDFYKGELWDDVDLVEIREDEGVLLTTSKEDAENQTGKSGKVFKHDINIQNPLIIDSTEALIELGGTPLIKYAVSNGHDSILAVDGGLVLTTNYVKQQAIGDKSDKPKLPSTQGKEKQSITNQAAVKQTPIESGLDAYDAMAKSISDGELNSAEPIKNVLNYLADNQESVKGELKKLNKKQLTRLVSGHVWSDTKKADLVDSAYRDMFSRFMFIGNKSDIISTTSYKLEDKIKDAKKHVDSLTDQQVAEYSQEQKAKIDAQKERLDQYLDKLKNPQTLDDYKAKIKAQGQDSLTTEQQAEYDKLIAGETIASKNEKPTEKEGLKTGGDVELGEPIEGVHGKTGDKIFNVQVISRLGKDAFKEAANFARSMGGGYYKGNFYFKSIEDAELFSGWVNGETVDTTEKQAERQKAKSQKNADKLKAMAEKAEQRASEALNADRKTNTIKRLGEAEAATAKAEKEIELSKIMRELPGSDTIVLKNATQKVQVELLNSLARSLVNSAPESQVDKDGNSRRTFKTEVSKAERAKHARMPLKTIKVFRLKEIARDMADTKGFVLLARKMNALIKGKSDQDFIDIDDSLIPKFIDYIENNLSQYDMLRDSAANYKRLDRMGISNAPTLRTALIEYMNLKESLSTGKSPSKLSQMERDLQRTMLGNRNAFNDFFPTPESLAGDIAEMADIEPGMKVLEPSAGNGLLADAAKEKGASVDVVEMGGQLREILQEKGHNLVGNDFLEYSPKADYDRVIMNPPFSNDQDIAHVEHAYKMLKPGGKLVAITSSMAGDRSNKTNKSFKEWLDSLDAEQQQLPANAFKSSLNPTGVNTKAIVLEKPAESINSSEKPSAKESANIGGEIDQLGADLKDSLNSYTKRSALEKRVLKLVDDVKDANGNWYLVQKKLFDGEYESDIEAGIAEAKGALVKSEPTKPNNSNANKPDRPQQSINDFGEKLGGARKDAWAGFSEAIIEQQDTAELPLSKSWPEPNYKELAEKGASPESIALMAAMRSEIPAKPRVARKVARWAKTVSDLKNFAKQIVTGERDLNAVMEKMRDHSPALASIVNAVPAIAKAEVEAVKSVADYRISSGSFSVFGGKKYSPSKTFYFVERNSKPIYEGASESLSDVQTLLSKQVVSEQAKGGKSNNGKQSNIGVYVDRYTKQSYLGWKGASGVLKIKEFKSTTDARQYLNENRAEVEKTLKQMKETPKMRKPVNEERAGPERYAGNVTPEIFTAEFGFRGVEFGNWVEQSKRQKDLNQAYDGLIDLAEALDIQPKALSLNGQLGLAFGARGKGGKEPAAAHYEPDTVVINLTKKAGAGSLAHEWWHALDNYFGKQKSRGEFITDMPYSMPTDQIRPEMANAFKHVRNAVIQSGLPERSRELDTRRSKAYWATNVEMTARSFETYIIDKLSQQGVANDYLANVVSDEAWSAAEALGFEGGNTYPYPNKSEQKQINTAYQSLFDAMESENTSEGIRLFSKSKARNKAKGVKLDIAQEIANDFIESLNGANGITVNIIETIAEAEKMWRMSLDGSTVKGAYSEMSKTVYVIAENIDSVTDLKQTLAHETIAHGGLDTVIGKEAKQAFIDRIKKTKGRKAFEKYWKDANKDYWDASEDVKAEEIFARFVENEPSKGEVKYWWQALKRFIRKQLDKLGIVYREDDEITAMRDMLESIVRGFKERKAARRAAKKRMALSKHANKTMSYYEARAKELQPQVNEAYEQGNFDAAEDLDAELETIYEYMDNRLAESQEDGLTNFGDDVGNLRNFDGGLNSVNKTQRQRAEQEAGNIDDGESSPLSIIMNTYKEYFVDGLTAWGEDKETLLRNAFMEVGESYPEFGGFDNSVSDQQIVDAAKDLYDSTVEVSNRKARPKKANFGKSIDSLYGNNVIPLFSRTAEEDTRTAKQKLGLEEQAAKTFSDMAKDKVNKTVDTLKSSPFWNRLNEGIFDGLSGIKNAEIAAGVTDPNRQGYVSARLASGLADVLHGVFNYGAPQWRNGIVQRKADTKGLLEVFGMVGDDLNNWLAWMGAHRAEQLKAQGRENNLTDSDIAELKALANGKERLFEQTRLEYNKINSAILDMAQQAGLLSDAQRSGFDEEYYVPFFRDMGETDPEMDDIKRMIVEPHTRKGIAGQSAQIKSLKGGVQSTKDLLENIIGRQSTLIDASLKNKAMQEVVNNLDGTDYLKSETSEDIASLSQQDLNKLGKVKVMVNGKPQAYVVSDPALLRALIQVNDIGSRSLFNKIGRSAKRFLTAGITLSPDFIFKNFVRDAAHAWMINKDGFTFGSDSVKGLKKAFKEDESYRNLIFSGAAFQGGYIHGADPEAGAQQMRRALRSKGLSSNEVEGYMATIVTSGATLLEKYRGISDKVENANRLSTYEAAIAAGKSKRQAAYEAKDLMDYSLKGNFALIGTMIDMLPFFNARLQGMSKLVRAAKASNDDRALRVLSANLAMKGIKVAGISMALAWANDDDEEYQQLPDWDKDMNWHIFADGQHIRVPKPFELGIIFGTLPERLFHYGTGTQTDKDLGKSVANAVFNTMALNPIPQMVLPAAEVMINKSFFKGSPIEGMADQNKQAEDRYNAYTSDTAKAIAQQFGVSPKKVEHLIKGYTGTIGGYVLGASDILARMMTGKVSPDTPVSRYPVVKAFYQGSGPKTNTKFSNDFYEALDAANQAYGSYKRAMELGDTTRQKELIEKDGKKLRSKATLAKVQRMISKLRKMQKAINDNDKLDGKQKREKLDDIQRKINAIYHKAYVTLNLGEW